MTAPRRWTQEPAVPGLALFLAIAAAGFVTMGIGWKVAARTLVVGHQMPALVSGGMGGLALVFIGAGLATIHAHRRLAADERARTDVVLEEADRVLAAIRGEET